jgi:hypothetical protein
LKPAKAKTLSALAEQLRRPAPADPRDPLVAALARRTRNVTPSRATLQSKTVRPSRPQPAPQLHRPAASAPSRTVAPPKVKEKSGAEHRKHPRAPVAVTAQLSLSSDPKKYFQATLPTSNISIGGMFLASTFFLKLGTKLEVTLTLAERDVHVKGEVVRVETSGSGGHSGFALRFVEYLDGSEVVLATHFLSPILREFLGEYASEHGFKASSEYVTQSVDLLAAWELKRAELGASIWMVPPAMAAPAPAARPRR